MLYVRALNPDAWMNVITGDTDPLDSDVISDLSTSNHELSVWEVDDNLSDMDDVAVALALTRDEVRDLTLVKLSPIHMRTSKYYNEDLDIKEQPGKTVFDKMIDRHKNFMLPSIWQMGFLAEYISSLITNDFESNCVIYDSTRLLDLINKAVDSGELDPDSLKKRGKWNKKAKALRTGASGSAKDPGIN